MSKKFVVVPPAYGELELQLVDDWLRQTEIAQQPYLLVWEQTRYATLRWTAMALSTPNKAKLAKHCEAIDAFQRALVRQYVKPGNRRTCVIGSQFSYFGIVEREKVHELATRLYDYLAHVLITGQPPETT